MNTDFSYVFHHKSKDAQVLSPVSVEEVGRVRLFHSGIEGYAPTPLVSLPGLAKRLGVVEVWVKDESKRFGLNAFKGLGGSFAIGKYLCEELGISMDEQAFAALRTPQAMEKLGQRTFVTATDGNHGRGVAWAAHVLGHNAVVYMPKGTVEERLRNIQALGAHAEILEVNYDDAVRHAAAMAEKHGWVLVQDTAWPGYEAIPTAILQGYTTMVQEAADELTQAPTHVLLQAGVGSMAGAVLGHCCSLWKDTPPTAVIVEPDKADCHYRTAKANDGTLHIVEGDMNSMMAGLCCGEPCSLSWPILNAWADAFVSCSDEYSARGMRLLGKPAENDPAIVSGESGAVPAGVLEAICLDPALVELKTALKLNEASRVLLISTEGDTDKENYRRILAQEETR
ncbi:MAG: diaminopropionate ammonia-lyase [Clostridia bacterium]|nr:diaminopropionate ammonia-lyase [Clostridia bacterium]